MRAPNSSSHSSTRSRRETRLRTDNVATAACRRGPNALPATSAGSSPVRSEAAAGAAHALAAMLGHPHRDLRQLLDLMTRRLPHRDPLRLREHVAAATRRRPVIDELVDRPRRQQLTTVPLMTRLPALGTTRAVLATPTRRRARRILARRQRRVTRVTTQPTLELLDPRLKLRDPTIHRQKHLDDRLTTRRVDRLRLSALHTPTFDNAELCPPTN